MRDNVTQIQLMLRSVKADESNRLDESSRMNDAKFGDGAINALNAQFWTCHKVRIRKQG